MLGVGGWGWGVSGWVVGWSGLVGGGVGGWVGELGSQNLSSVFQQLPSNAWNNGQGAVMGMFTSCCVILWACSVVSYHCPACLSTLVATRFRVAVICPILKCLTVLEFSFILFDLCLLITFFNFIMNYVPIVTFWIFTYHKIWILSIMFCFIWSYWIIYFLACLEVSWRVVS